MKMIDGFPRRNRLDLLTPAEKSIRAAVDAVEVAGCDPLLTDAVVLLGQAQDKVADFVEKAEPKKQPKLITAPDERNRCCVLNEADERCIFPAKFWIGQNHIDDYTHTCEHHREEMIREGDSVEPL